MTDTLRAEALALCEALRRSVANGYTVTSEVGAAYDALRARLAEPEPSVSGPGVVAACELHGLDIHGHPLPVAPQPEEVRPTATADRNVSGVPVVSGAVSAPAPAPSEDSWRDEVLLMIVERLEALGTDMKGSAPMFYDDAITATVFRWCKRALNGELEERDGKIVVREHPAPAVTVEEVARELPTGDFRHFGRLDMVQMVDAARERCEARKREEAK